MVNGINVKLTAILLMGVGAGFFVFPEAVAGEQAMSLRNRVRIKKQSQLVQRGENGSEEFNAEKTELLQQRRRYLIQDIKRFLREAKSSDQKAELNLRLGTLYMEDYYAALAEAQQDYESKVTQHKVSNKKADKAPSLDTSEAFVALDRARAIYRDLVARYPNHPRRDEMYYSLALASLDRGVTQEGMAYFERLIRQTPNSKYGNEALVQLGDHYFEQNNFLKAEWYYDRLLSKRYLPLLPYASYKKAWCVYNLGRHAESLIRFKSVIEHEEMGEEAGTSSIRIRNEALKDITLPFVELKQVDESITFFRNFGQPHYRNGMESMAGHYFETGDYAHAITLNQVLLGMDANHAKNPHYELAIVEALKMKSEENAAVARLFGQLPNYLENSNWYEIHVAEPRVIQEAAKQFEEIAWKYAVQFHAEGQKTKNPARYELAKGLYKKYLEFFPRTNRTPQARFHLAEILYKQEKYVEAAHHYYEVYKEPMARNLKLDAIRSALMSLDRQLNLERRRAGLSEVSSKSQAKLADTEESESELTPYSDAETRFMEIAAEYLRAYPKAKDGPDVLYELAYLQYVHRDFTRAYQTFWNVVNNHPQNRLAYSASHLLLDILNRRKDYGKLVALCKQLIIGVALSKPTFRAEIADILRKAELKRIMAIEESGLYKNAADQYLEYTKAYGSQDEALFEKALYNAGINYSRANYHLLAVETREKFLRRFPNSQFREQLLLQVAKTYELLTNFERAAHYLEQYSQQYPKSTHLKNALRLSGLYYWGSGNKTRAEHLMLNFYHSYPADRKIIERDLLDLYDSSGQTDKMVQYLLKARAQKGIPITEYVSQTLRVAELQARRTGKTPIPMVEEALRVSQRYPKEMETPKGKESLAKILFWFAARKEATFHQIKLTLPQRQLEVNLQRKLVLVKELERDYAKIASIGSTEWGVGSMAKAATLYRQMATEVQQAPVPGELSAEQVEIYRNEIQKTFVKPFTEKALGLVLQCLDKVQEFTILSMWTPRCYGLAAELDPSRYPPVRTFYLPPLQLSLLTPLRNESKVAIGNLKSYAYPFFSSALFTHPDRQAASEFEIANIYNNDSQTSSGAVGSSPGVITYRSLNDERRTILNQALTSEKNGDRKHSLTFAYLNLLRLVSANHAVPLITEAIQREPTSDALHNLLALTYLEVGNLPAAKITWLALVARNVKNASIWNNLGVLACLEGNEAVGIDYFHEASLMESPREALVNLAFLALKYRNGFEAKKHFERALSLDMDQVTTQVGYAVARLQNRELDSAKESLIELNKKYKSDPYARLSLAYFLIDVEKEHELAKQILSEYIDQQSIDSDTQFRQALQESRRQIATGEELPAIGQ